MKTVLTVMLIIAVLLMSSCDPETGVLTLSGTYHYTLDANVKIGLFGPEANFTSLRSSDIVNTGDGDSFVPLVVVTPDENGDYSIEFPADPTTVAYLVAWIEYVDDNIFDVMNQDEQGYFPTKTVNSVDYVISGWQAVGDIIQALESSGQNTFNLDSIGPGGFDFGTPPQ